MKAVYDSIVSPPEDIETNPYWRTESGNVLLNLQRFVASEFIRKYFDKRFNQWVMPRNFKKRAKDEIRLEATLWGETWKMIEQLYSRSMFAPDHHPALTFFKIVHERVLLQPYLTYISEAGKQLTSTEMGRKAQSQNRALQKLGNEELLYCIPFDRDVTPITWQLVEQCRRLAYVNEDFREQYTKVVKARMALTASILNNHPKFLEDGKRKIEYRGRKPKY